MRSLRDRRIVIRASLALLLSAGLAGCGSGGGGVTDNCDATEAHLEGTWAIATAERDGLTCPSGGDPVHTGDGHSFGGVTAATSGNTITIVGDNLRGTLDNRTCNISYTFLDEHENVEFTCNCEFNPGTQHIDGHCTRVRVDSDGDGALDTSCNISPSLDSEVDISG